MNEDTRKEVEAIVTATIEKGLTEGFAEKIQEVAKSFMADQAEKTKAFNLTNNPVDAAAAAAKGKYADTVKFLNAFTQGDKATIREIAEVRAKTLNEGAISDGGALVPIEFERSIIEYMNEYNEIRSNARVIQTNTNEVRLNELVSKVAVYKDGELVTATESDPVYGQPTITISKWMGITTMSEELYEDSEINLIDDLARQFAEQLALAEQNDMVNGTDSGQEGLLKVSGTTNINLLSGTTFGDVTWDDLSNMQVSLFAIDKDAVKNNRAKFYMSMPVYHLLRTKKTSGSGEYFVLPEAPTKKTPASAWGAEIVVLNEYPTSSATATKFVTYSDLKKHLIIADRRGIRMTQHTEGTVGNVNLLTQDARALKVTKRTGFTTALENGIVNLATN